MKYSNLNELHFKQSTQSLDIIEKANIIAKRCNETFSKGLVTENELEKAFTALDNQLRNDLEKARITKYFKREGSPGNYKYYYTEAEYKEVKGKSKKEEESGENNNLVGKKAEDYNGTKGKIIAQGTFKEYKKLKKYDSSGWLHSEAHKEFDLDENDIIVAFKEDKTGEVNVYTFENGGVELVK